MDISSDESERPNVLYMPGSEPYETAFEKLYGKKGVPPIEKGKEIVPVRTHPPTGESTKVLLMRDHALVFPEMWLQVFVVGPPEDARGFAQLFSRASCTRADSVEDADLVVFTGGPDVEPEYYGAPRHGNTYTNEDRDHADINVYMQCLDQGVPMTGVCRGAQFLAVMNGYKLFQHIDGHHGDHKMWDCKQKMMLERVSSVHHQCVMGGEGMEVLGVAHEAKEKWMDNERVVRAKNNNLTDIEAYFIRDTCCLGVQGHPEYRDYHNFSKWYLEQINETVVLNPDVIWDSNSRRRLNPEFIEERKLLKKSRGVKEIITIPEPEGGL